MKICPVGADLIHADRLGEFAKLSKNVQRGLYNNYCLKTINFPFILVRSETTSLHSVLCLNFTPHGSVPKLHSTRYCA
jgi:hypothetical protein